MSDDPNDPFGNPPPSSQPHQPQPGLQPPVQPGFQQPVQPGAPLPTGLKTTAIVFLIIGPVLTVIGMVPCLGILNWLAIPTNVALTFVGILGLVAGPKEADGRAANLPLHVGAIITGLILAALSFLRCLAGGGVA